MRRQSSSCQTRIREAEQATKQAKKDGVAWAGVNRLGRKGRALERERGRERERKGERA